MTGYIYNVDSHAVIAVLHSSQQSKIEAAAIDMCDDQDALTFSPAFGFNDGLTMDEDVEQINLDA